MIYYCLRGGRVYDPTANINGEIRDIWMLDGKIVAPPASPESVDVVDWDARGDVVMAGGVDMHCHIAGAKVNAARRLQSATEGGQRSRFATAQTAQTAPIVPHCRATGQLFAGLGYTTAVDAAIPGLSSRLAHHEFALTPYIDKAFLTLFGNNHYVLEKIGTGEQEAVRDYCRWMLSSVQAHGVKIVNPGGVENWKQISRKSLAEFDHPIEHFGVTPRQIVQALSTAVEDLNLPHPVHIHCNNLGYPGNWETTLQTMQSLEGRRGHFAHIQFHSYAGDPNDPGSFSSAVEPLVEYVAAHPEISVDVGHICPGTAMTITGDAPFAEHLHELTGGRWYTSDTEQEASCGIIPGKFRPYKNLVHATQWAIGLEWYLRMPDPWRIAMSSDHPNGGAFVKYPQVIHLLMSKAYRDELLARMPGPLTERSGLAELDREYSLLEIATITRAAPAKMLGMAHKGHLQPGADADLTIYSEQSNFTEMFQRPRMVIKAGREIVRNGDLRPGPTGQLLTPTWDQSPPSSHELRSWFNATYSIRFGNYRIAAGESPCELKSVQS